MTSTASPNGASSEVLSEISGGSSPKRSGSGSSTDKKKWHNHQHKCHSHSRGHHSCYCIKHFYEEDEVCRKNPESGKLEFGIVSRYEGSGNLKIFWTLEDEIEEEDLENVADYSELRLIDRLATPGDLIKVNKKQGEVQEVLWVAIIKLQDNNSILLDIPCHRLEPLVTYFPGQKLVDENGWIGMITRVHTEATLMFGKGNTGIVDCTSLPPDQQPYPGRKVRYSVEQYMSAGLESLNGGKKFKEVFKKQEFVDAFVLFLNVGKVEVVWSGRISASGGSKPKNDDPPSEILSRNYLKKRVKVLGETKDFNWDNHPEAVERLYNCNVRPTDEVLDVDANVEEYIERKYFSEDKESAKPAGKCSSTQVCKMGKTHGGSIMTNVDYVCRVLRFSRVLKVKWCGSGKVDKIRASIVTSKHSFGEPFRQIVQRKVSLAPYAYDEYGITSTRDLNDILSVKWFSRPRPLSNSESESTLAPHFRTKYQSLEPVFDLEPHFSYGRISAGAIVYRSVSCILPEPLFSIGWVRAVSPITGQVTVIDMHTKAEHFLFPNELECTGVKVDGDLRQGKSDNGCNLLKYHSLYNLQISDQLFTQNLLASESFNSVLPEHFKVLSRAPKGHTFFGSKFVPGLDGKWYKAVKREQLYLSSKSELATIWLKGFKDRLDLYCVLIAGLQGTPFEGGLFTFDVQLGPRYPEEPPLVNCTTMLSEREGCTLKHGACNLELDDNLSAPYGLVQSLVSLQTSLFSGGILMELPSSAASLQRSSFKQENERLANMWTVIDVLDLTFRNVFDPPSLWVNECLQYFKMSNDWVKKKLMKIVDGLNDEGVGYPIQPVSDGWIDAVLGRLRRIDEAITSYDFDSDKGDTSDYNKLDDEEVEEI